MPVLYCIVLSCIVLYCQYCIVSYRIDCIASNAVSRFCCLVRKLGRQLISSHYSPQNHRVRATRSKDTGFSTKTQRKKKDRRLVIKDISKYRKKGPKCGASARYCVFLFGCSLQKIGEWLMMIGVDRIFQTVVFSFFEQAMNDD